MLRNKKKLFLIWVFLLFLPQSAFAERAVAEATVAPTPHGPAPAVKSVPPRAHLEIVSLRSCRQGEASTKKGITWSHFKCWMDDTTVYLICALKKTPPAIIDHPLLSGLFDEGVPRPGGEFKLTKDGVDAQCTSTSAPLQAMTPGASY